MVRARTAWRVFRGGVVIVVTVAAAQVARAHDFPTHELVQYVETCMLEREASRTELRYKCSCVMDRLAERWSFDDFVERLTAARATNIAGERGSVVRDSGEMQALAAEFRTAEAKARKACFLE